MIMRITQGKVIEGRIVIEGQPLPEGALVTPDDRTFTLSEEDEAALLLAVAEADRGELLDADEVFDRLP